MSQCPERSHNLYTDTPDTPPSLDKKKRARKMGAAALIGAICCAGCGGAFETESSRMNEREVTISQETTPGGILQICGKDGQKITIREVPRTSKIDDPTDLVKVKIQGCATIPSDHIRVFKEEPNGIWYGAPERDVAKALPGLGLDQAANTNYVWVSWQTAKLNPNNIRLVKK